MNRRGFLSSLGRGIAAIAIASSVPLEKLQAFVPFSAIRECVALEYLRLHYNAFMEQVGEPPDEMLVGSALFALARSEMPAIARYTSNDPKFSSTSLMFRATPMIEDGDGWGLKFKKSMITHNPRKLGVISSM